MNTMQPIIVKDDRIDMEAAFIGRYAIEHLPEEWRQLGTNGFYVLLSPLERDNSFEAYVGQTRTLFELRLSDHNERREFWTEAILFKKYSGTTLTSTQVNWIEGELVRLLRQGRHIKLHNKAWTGDTSLPQEEEMLVEDVSLFAMRTLFLRGYRSESLGKEVHKLEDSVQQRPTPAVASTQLAAPRAEPKASLSEVHVTNNPQVDLVPNNLWETLRKWRWRARGESNMQHAYSVCHDAQLRLIEERRPQVLSDLHGIESFGAQKVARYGPSLIATLQAFYASERATKELQLATELPQQQRKGWFKR